MRTPTQATPVSRASSIAVSAARATTRWPMPLSPSTSAVAGAERVTLMFGCALIALSLSRVTYCGSRKTPCASEPVRSASSISSATLAASPAGSPALFKASAISPLTATTGVRFVVFASMSGLSRKKSLRAGAEDRRLVGVGYLEAAHVRDAIHHRHIVGIIAAQHDPGSARPFDQEGERFVGMRDGVVEEAADDGGRLLRNILLRLRPHAPAMNPAPGLVGHEAAGMGEADFQPRVPVHDAAEHETSGGDGGVERIADQIDQIIGLQPLGA